MEVISTGLSSFFLKAKRNIASWGQQNLCQYGRFEYSRSSMLTKMKRLMPSPSPWVLTSSTRCVIIADPAARFRVVVKTNDPASGANSFMSCANVLPYKSNSSQQFAQRNFLGTFDIFDQLQEPSTTKSKPYHEKGKKQGQPPFAVCLSGISLHEVKKALKLCVVTPDSCSKIAEERNWVLMETYIFSEVD